MTDFVYFASKHPHMDVKSEADRQKPLDSGAAPASVD